MLQVTYQKSFEKDVKRAIKRGLDTSKLEEVIRLLANGDLLPSKYRDHMLIGHFVGFRECHIQPDWLLIYKRTPHEIIFVRTGTHSDLFK